MQPSRGTRALAADPVVVIGAGPRRPRRRATLDRRRVDVTVLEARDRVGGRAWTVRLDNGALAELGGEWVFPGYVELDRWADRFGLELVPTGVDFLRREPMGGPRASRQEASSPPRAALAAIPPDERRADPRWFLSAGRAGTGRAAVRRRLRGTCAVPLEQVALGRGGSYDPRRPPADAAGSRAATRRSPTRSPPRCRRPPRSGRAIRRARRPRGAGPRWGRGRGRRGRRALPLPARWRRVPSTPAGRPREALRAAHGRGRPSSPSGSRSAGACATRASTPFWWWTALGEGGPARAA